MNLQSFIEKTENALLDHLNPSGYIEGELSSSALATALSIITLKCSNPIKHNDSISNAYSWLLNNINQDGGYGDTINSPSNVSTSLLVWAAFNNSENKDHPKLITYLNQNLDELTPLKIKSKLESIYGIDKTFAIPIIMACIISERFGPKEKAWNHLEQLPFELSVLPHQAYHLFNMSVVSYAIPALIAIGILTHTRKNNFSFLSPLRSCLKNKALKKLSNVQPKSGGYLEAVPLTAFVTMALIESGSSQHRIVENGLSFLLTSIRKDGSSAIDTNLNTWLSSLSFQSLYKNKPKSWNSRLSMQWLAAQQTTSEHFYAGSKAGAWPWTPESGGVPDSDDTSAALLTLLNEPQKYKSSIEAGVKWLIQLQNKDGGIPTFCRGWGRLPFDQSCSDITAHALRVLVCYQNIYNIEKDFKLQKAIDLAYLYLLNKQNDDGSWVPLWFGNQLHPEKENPIYGTSKVLLALNHCHQHHSLNNWIDEARIKAANYILKSQNDDGGLGGYAQCPSSIEESALALGALSGMIKHKNINSDIDDSTKRILNYLDNSSYSGTTFKASPIGLYFASLWYSEKLYPIIYTYEALLLYQNQKIGSPEDTEKIASY